MAHRIFIDGDLIGGHFRDDFAHVRRARSVRLAIGHPQDDVGILDCCCRNNRLFLYCLELYRRIASAGGDLGRGDSDMRDERVGAGPAAVRSHCRIRRQPVRYGQCRAFFERAGLGRAARSP
jgi:hypothetical protein